MFNMAMKGELLSTVMDLVTMVPGYEECHTLCQVREDEPNSVKVKPQRFFDSLGLILNTIHVTTQGQNVFWFQILVFISFIDVTDSVTMASYF